MPATVAGLKISRARAIATTTAAAAAVAASASSARGGTCARAAPSHYEHHKRGGDCHYRDGTDRNTGNYARANAT